MPHTLKNFIPILSVQCYDSIKLINFCNKKKTFKNSSPFKSFRNYYLFMNFIKKKKKLESNNFLQEVKFGIEIRRTNLSVVNCIFFFSPKLSRSYSNLYFAKKQKQGKQWNIDFRQNSIDKFQPKRRFENGIWKILKQFICATHRKLSKDVLNFRHSLLHAFTLAQ